MNVKFYYAYKFFKDTIPIYPVYILMFEVKGLSILQISWLLAIWSFSVVVFEIPSGVIADHWSRKNMLLLSALFKGAGYILWFFSNGFILFALGFVLWGISESFCSGSEEALLYDNLKATSQEALFAKVYGRGNFFSGIGVALSSVAGGFLTIIIGYRGVLLVSVLFVMISMLFILKFKEMNLFKKTKDEQPDPEAHKLVSTWAEASLFCLRNKGLFITILMLVLVIGVAGILDEYDPLIAKGYGLNLGLVGVWIGIRYVLEAAGARFAYQIKKIFITFGFNHDFRIVTCLCLAGGGLLLIFALGRNVVLIPLYGLFYFLLSAAGVIQEAYVQTTIEKQGRATVHSVMSLLHNIYGMFFILLLALVFSEVGIYLGIVIISLYICIISLILFLGHTIYIRRESRN